MPLYFRLVFRLSSVLVVAHVSVLHVLCAIDVVVCSFVCLFVVVFYSARVRISGVFGFSVFLLLLTLLVSLVH